MYFSIRTPHWLACAALVVGCTLAQAQADNKAPDALVKEVATDVLETAKADKEIRAGDLKKIGALVDSKVLPYVDFEHMTASAMGRYWNQATPEQKTRLQEEFKYLLIRTYSGALTQVKDQSIEVESSRIAVDDTKPYTVKTKIRGGAGDPIQLNYDLIKTPAGWKIIDLNVSGVSLVIAQRTSFAQEIGISGIQGLIDKLAERNKRAGATKS
jgi:phospholipid transport system substrate-binding protein